MSGAVPPPGEGKVERKLRELEALSEYGRQRSALHVAVAAIGTFLSAALLWSAVLDWRNNSAYPATLLGLVALGPYASPEGAAAWWVAGLVLILLVLAMLTAASGAWGVATVTAVAGLVALVAEIVLWVVISRNEDAAGPGVVAAAGITFLLLAWAAVSAFAIRDLGPQWAVAYRLDDGP